MSEIMRNEILDKNKEPGARKESDVHRGRAVTTESKDKESACMVEKSLAQTLRKRP